MDASEKRKRMRIGSGAKAGKAQFEKSFKESQEPAQLKRFTVDIEQKFHRAMKVEALERDITVKEVVQEMLAERYGDKGKQK